MVKNSLVAGGSLLFVGVLLFAENAVGDNHTSAGSEKDSARENVPLEFERQRGRAMVEGDRENGNLEILGIKFAPIHQGTNVVRVEVKNASEQGQVFGIHIQTRSPKYLGRFAGFGRPFFDHLQAKQAKWTRFEFEIYGPITDATWIRLQFYNPPSVEQYDFQNWFKQLRYTGGDLEHRNSEQDQLRPATESQEQAVISALRQIRNHIKNKDYEAAWTLFAKDYRESTAFGEFKKSLDAGLFEKMGFFDLRVESVIQHVGYLRLNAKHEDQIWVMDFVEERGQWKIDFMRPFRNTRDWKARLLPKMQKRSTKHFDIYYLEGSTAEKEIDQIVQQREKGFQEICKFLGKGSDVRVCLVFFENAEVKAAETGHRGAGWAFGNTVVEVYNEQQKLDPYHELVHILTRPYGSPPALFSEGVAVYMAERLGAHALASHGAGQSSIYAWVRELKSKGEWIPLQELLRYTEIGPGWSRPPVSYPEAASFVKFLIDTYGKDKFLEAYKTLKNSPDKDVQHKNVKALEQLYGKPLRELEREWEKTISLGKTTPRASCASSVVPAEGYVPR